MSWRVQVQADSSGMWASNRLRFASRDEADDYGRNLAGRWVAVRQWRSVESEEPVTHVCLRGKAVPLEEYTPVRKVTMWQPGYGEDGE